MRDSNGRFVKGSVPANKGVPMSDEVKAKVSASKTGVKATGANLKRLQKHILEVGKNTRFKKGVVHSPELIAKIAKANTKYTAEELKEHQKQWVQDNIQHVYAQQKEWRDANKERVKEYTKKSRQKHKDRVNATNARYRAERLQRTPAWLLENDFNEMQQMYTMAKRRSEVEGIQYHVDHIIPLKGKNVSGLHVPSNLQIITWRENITKNNRFEGEFL